MNALSDEVKLAREELDKAYQELIEQEERILEYQKNFTRIRSNFQSVYSKIKAYHPVMQKNIETYKEVRKYLDNNLSQLSQQNQALKTQIAYIKPILQASLSAEEYNKTATRLDTIINVIDTLDKNLNALNSQLYYENPDKMLSDYNEAISTLDETNVLLQNIYLEINKGIELINKNKQRVQTILAEIQSGKEELENLRSQLRSTSNYKIVFNDTFALPETASYLFFPLLFTLIIAFTSIILSNMFIIEQTHKQSYIRESITPTFDITFLLGDFIVSLGIVLFQVLILFVIGYSMFNLYIFNNFLYLLTISIIVSSIFVLLGMSLGYLIKSRHISILIATFTLLFLVIFSDILVPRELTGFLFKALTTLNPFVISNQLLFNKMVFSESIELAPVLIILLFFYLVLFSLIAYLSKKIGKYRIIKE